MGHTYEIVFAPSEQLSEYGARAVGTSVELAIFSHYLEYTRAPVKPPGGGPPADYMDTGNRYDYVKLLEERHPELNRKEIRKDAATKGAMGVPDISTLDGRYVPPRIVSGGPHPVEDTSRSEYYEIKPNSDSGESDGLKKLAKIEDGNPRYGIPGIYKPGAIYPGSSPTYIPLKFSQAFEYLKLVFMWENNLKTCEIDLQVVKRPGPKLQGIIFYAIRVRFELDFELAREKLLILLEGIAVALAACAAAGILELAADLIATEVTKSLLDTLSKLIDSSDVPTEPPRFRIAPDPPIGPRVAEPPITPPSELPEVDLEPEDFDADNDLVPKLKKALGAAALGRGFALPRKKMNIFCDEDFFNNVLFDDATVRRFISMTQLALPLYPTLTLSAAYLRMAVPGWRLADLLMEQIEKRFPNQCQLKSGQRIPQALRGLSGTQVTIVSQVLVLTPEIAAFLDPALAANARAYSSGRFKPGSIALPPQVLSRWKGRDAQTGASPKGTPLDVLATKLLAGNPDARNRKYLTDALAAPGFLRHGLQTAPGFTLALGVHALYQLPGGGVVTEQNRYGELKAVNVSRLFAVNAAEGPAPGKPYEKIASGKGSDGLIPGASEAARFLGRMGVHSK